LTRSASAAVQLFFQEVLDAQIGRAILEAASAGERDRGKLKQAALTETSFV